MKYFVVCVTLSCATTVTCKPCDICITFNVVIQKNFYRSDVQFREIITWRDIETSCKYHHRIGNKVYQSDPYPFFQLQRPLESNKYDDHVGWSQHWTRYVERCGLRPINMLYYFTILFQCIFASGLRWVWRWCGPVRKLSVWLE